MADAHPTAHEHTHPTPGTYAKIGLFLFVLTALGFVTGRGRSDPEHPRADDQQ